MTTQTDAPRGAKLSRVPRTPKNRPAAKAEPPIDPLPCSQTWIDYVDCSDPDHCGERHYRGPVETHYVYRKCDANAIAVLPATRFSFPTNGPAREVLDRKAFRPVCETHIDRASLSRVAARAGAQTLLW